MDRNLTPLVLVALLSAAAASPPTTTLTIFADNPRYFAVDGRPVFLIGATHQHGWTPISRLDHDFRRDLTRLAAAIDAAGSPHVRGLVRVLPYDPMNPHDRYAGAILQPWVRQEDGRFDLERFAPAWEARLRDYLSAARDLGIIVSLELWDDWSVTRGPGGEYDPEGNYGWNGHPFNPRNNVNYDEAALPAATSACDAPFYQTIGGRPQTEPVLRLQQRYADRLLAIAGPFPNVLFNLSNESRASLRWSRYWAEYVRARLPEGRLIGEMPSTNRRDGGGECDEALSPATLSTDDRYDYVDVAQAVSTHELGQDPARQALEGARRMAAYGALMARAGRIRPLAISKDYARDPDGGPIVLWSRLTGGAASARFHRPSAEMVHYSDGHFDAVARLAEFAGTIPFWTMEYDPEAIAALPPAAGANVLARPGEVYVVQIVGESTGDRIGLRLEAGAYRVRWLDPLTGQAPGGIDAPALHPQDEAGVAWFDVPPNGGHVVLHVVRP